MSHHGSSPEEEAPQSISPSAPTLHAAFSSLKKEVIGAHTGLRNYERGLEYWRAGRVRDRRAEGETISARCTGNSPNGRGYSRPCRFRSPDSPPAKTKCAKPG